MLVVINELGTVMAGFPKVEYTVLYAYIFVSDLTNCNLDNEVAPHAIDPFFILLSMVDQFKDYNKIVFYLILIF